MVFLQEATVASMSDQLEFDLDLDDKELIVEANEIVWSQTLDWINKIGRAHV